MGLSDTQLDTWSNPGAQKAAAQTYASIKAALDGTKWPEGPPEVYLQGSYRNDTNVRAESAVDVVVELPETFKSDTAALTSAERAAHAAATTEATYRWDDGHGDTLAALRRYYGNEAVVAGTKAICVPTPYLVADVVVAIELRRYVGFIPGTDGQCVSGIAVWVPSEKQWHTNYPKQHYANGVSKQQRTQSRFKPMVRAFKKAALRCAELGLIDAPSYASECFVYSAPDEYFLPSRAETFRAIVNWAAAGNYAAIRRVSEQGLYVGAEPGQWPIQEAAQYVNALINLWNQG